MTKLLVPFVVLLALLLYLVIGYVMDPSDTPSDARIDIFRDQ